MGVSYLHVASYRRSTVSYGVERVIVYKLTSPSGKSYVGLTVATVKRRFSQHKTLWRKLKRQGVRDYRGMQVTSLLFFAFDKYDPSLWTHEVLFESDDSDAVRSMEIAMIQEHGTLAPGGYNVLLGGQMGHAGRKLSEEHKAKQRAARLAYYASDQGKAHLEQLSGKMKGNLIGIGRESYNKGMKLGARPDHVRKAISDKMKGRPLTEEHKYKISQAKKKAPKGLDL
jgi:hypothetical protein